MDYRLKGQVVLNAPEEVVLKVAERGAGDGQLATLRRTCQIDRDDARKLGVVSRDEGMG